MIYCKRVYDAVSSEDGYRVLVDRLWPRGIKKVALDYDEWNKALAPSTELRKWFHENGDFTQFTARYIKELEAIPESWQPLLKVAKEKPLVLLYSAKDEKQNNAVVLMEFLQKQCKTS